ncbi:translation initiation factor IF-2 [Suncus etruscus]|uniref:translation initiation factor IF-2 n=1 Tax=Suncus etruscus TaxID=109475 RepID=UPI00210F586F|nr:translation initiation factor IF-2 [Suncus etruscus]
MPQGAGPLAERGGAPDLGAGPDAKRGVASEQAPAGGVALSPGAGLEPEEGGASGAGPVGAEALSRPGGGTEPSGAGLKSEGGGACIKPTVLGAWPHPLRGVAKEAGEGPGPGNGPGRPRGGGLRGGGAWGRARRPRTPPGEAVWVERARGPPDTGPVWVPRRPPRAQSWGGVPGGGSSGSAWGVPAEDRGSPEPPSSEVWVPRGRPPAAAAEVWVRWAGGNWVWREWARPGIGTPGVQPERVWTLRKGSGGN